MKIFDCFIFFNELDLLEFRLKLLDTHVDFFVIAESNITHSGKTKPYFFEENKKRFDPWLHKIIYFPVKQTTEGFDLTIKESAYNPKAYSWQLENEHRNALSAAADMISDTDKVIVGDLDEIPNPFLLKKINPADEPVALSMLFHYYFFNCQRIAMDRWWNGSVVTSGKNFKKFAPQIFRDNRNNYTRSKKAGWHFSYLGGAEKIKYKIRSFAHTELDSEEFLQDEHLLKVISNAEDIFKRPGFRFKFVSLYNYPFWLRKQMLDYPLFLSGVFQRSTLKKNWFALKRIFS